MDKKKIMVVFGTRPEAIKMCPLVLELQKSEKLETYVCVTGQHKEMLQQVLDIFKIEPDENLAIMKSGQDLYDITTKVLLGMRDILKREKPDLILVHGDTTTAYTSAMAAFYQQIPIGHVEAGLRTNNLYSPYPEEFNRQGIGILAELHFSPTVKAKQNLLSEGKDESKIFVTGNTGIDALHTTVKENFSHPIIDWAKGSRLLVITAHRRENLGDPMHEMFRAIRRIVEEFDDVKAVYPVHLNPLVRSIANEELEGCDRIKLIEPLSVEIFHNFLKASYLILTDSGGIQEEAPALGKPVLVMRDTTERPEGVEAGTLKLVGTSEESIYTSCRELLVDSDIYSSMSKAKNPYGDGTASKQIRKIIEEWAEKK
ncbi:MAG: UDP-N-acetylglucosamine 2-epimerase (non-hydrolyzing) [Butyrivibrio sp.]|nr:UDP-N-acetylglucosamine 2-epimerase (non-hydrolyzing) [Butyrivibrio sp.]